MNNITQVEGAALHAMCALTSAGLGTASPRRRSRTQRGPTWHACMQCQARRPSASPDDVAGTLEPPDKHAHTTDSPTAAPAFGWPRLRNCGRRCSSRGHGCMKVNSGGGPEAGLSLSRASIWLAAAASVSHRDCCRVTGSSLQARHTLSSVDGGTHHTASQAAQLAA